MRNLLFLLDKIKLSKLSINIYKIIIDILNGYIFSLKTKFNILLFNYKGFASFFLLDEL